MCGIAGIYSGTMLADEEVGGRLLRALAHRGPDAGACVRSGNLLLAHTRLSIQDLSPNGNQPMWDEERECCLVFNGEIYNFHELRQELSHRAFRSSGDSEVLLYALKEWGVENALSRFNGMFSFCFYDSRRRTLSLARDRLGIKPLLYYWDGVEFAFASELKAIVSIRSLKLDVREDALSDYLIHRYIPAPKTIYRNVYKVQAGQLLEFDLEKRVLQAREYWSPTRQRRFAGTTEEAIETFDELISDSVRLRLIADTPVSTFLSGGIDSTAVTAVARRQSAEVVAFCIDLEPKCYSELHFADEASRFLGVRLESKTVGRREYLGVLDRLFSHMDEPFADSSLIPMYILCEFVRSKGYKVALSGDGADELFFGYRWHRTFARLGLVEGLFGPLSTPLAKLFRNGALSCLLKKGTERYRRVMFDRFTNDEVAVLLGYVPKESEDYLYRNILGVPECSFEDLSILDLSTFLRDDVLPKVDLASMAFGLEVRVPFLDHRIVEFSLNLPLSFHFSRTVGKRLLRTWAKGKIPELIRGRGKKGFSAPVHEWLGDSLEHEVRNGELVRSGRLANLDRVALTPGKLWQLYVLERWFSALERPSFDGAAHQGALVKVVI